MKLRRFVPIVVVLTACSGTTARHRNCVTSRDAEDRARWSVNLESAPGALAVDETGAVVTLDGDAVLALDGDGTQAWRTAVPGAGLDWPVIDGDIVVVPVSRPEGAGCVALDRESGDVRWRVGVGPGVIAASAVAGGRVVCASADGTLVVADRASGDPRWSVKLAEYFGGPVAISPRGSIAVDPETGRVGVVIRAAGRWALACWDLATGADVGCTYDLGTGAPPSAVTADGAGTFVVGAGGVRRVMLVDLKANRLRATVPTDDAFDPASIPLVVRGLAIVVDRGGGVTAIDIASGAERWRADLGQPVLDARPVVAGGVVAVVDWTGRIHTFRLIDGRRAHRMDDSGGAIGVGGDPESRLLVAIDRGFAGNRAVGGRVEGGSKPGAGSEPAATMSC
jgi:outer membrane protein assembly factor BamB